MAEKAANLGVELFVMDDGWFGNRDTDNSGLGDWHVNEEKLGCTLTELSDRIHAMGLKFGIWYEPRGFPRTAASTGNIPTGCSGFRDEIP